MPDNYFSQLNEEIRVRARLEDLKDLSGDGGFTVPPLYFEQLGDRVRTKLDIEAKPKKIAKIVRLWHSDLFKYASAACFIFVTAFGLYFSNQQHKTVSANDDMVNEQVLFDVDEQTIIDQIHNQTTTTTNASQQELEDYILNNYSQNDIASNL